MIKRATVVLATTLALTTTTGCAEVHAVEGVAPGIYELTVERDADACSPTRATGAMGAVAVLVSSGAIDAPVPDVTASLLAAPRVRLSPEGSFHAETNRRVADCDGAWVHEEWTVMETTEAGFEVLHTQDWQGLASCTPSGAGIPEGDCVAERRLRYALTTACHAPCALRLGASGAVDCACE